MTTTVLLALNFSVCAQTETVYRPGDTPRFDDAAQAEGVIRQVFSRWYFFPAASEPPSFVPARISQVRFGNNEVVLDQNRQGTTPITLPYESLANPEVVAGRKGLAREFFGVRISPQLVLWCFEQHVKIRKESTTSLTDALHSLYKLKVEEPRFNEAAEKYRTASVKPVLNEEMRKYKIQAESLIRAKQFTEAARLYRDSLQFAPWWPEGRYNRALVLAELQRYREVSAEMKRFLKLEPEFADARVLQDKIYEWEILAKGR